MYYHAAAMLLARCSGDFANVALPLVTEPSSTATGVLGCVWLNSLKYLGSLIKEMSHIIQW